MKKLFRTFIVLILVLTLFVPATALANVGGEGCDSFGSAYSLDASSVSGVLTAGDRDYFAFMPEYTLKYTFKTTGGTNTHGWLYDSNHALLVQDASSGVGSNFSITRKLISGRLYYLKIAGENASVTGAYTLSVSHEAPERGNTNGNIINGGFACLKGSTIYYANSHDGYKLYKIKTDNTGKAKITNDKAQYINVVGGYVYYANASSGNKLYRIKTNGTGRQKMTDYSVSNVIVVGGWVYYIDADSNMACKLRISAFASEPPYGLADWEVNFLNVYGDNLYFMNQADGNSLYKTNLMGGNVRKLNDRQSFFVIADNSKVYYEDLDALSRVYSVSLNGTGRTTINKNSSVNINYSSGWIYFVNEDSGNRLYKIKTDGTGKTKVTIAPCQGFCVVGNYIYYYNDTYDTYYRIKTNGTGNQAVK